MSYLVEIVSNAKAEISQVSDIFALNKIRIKYLGKKGYFTLEMESLRKLSPEKKSRKGAFINEAKKQVKKALYAKKIDLENIASYTSLIEENIDISLPGRFVKIGSLHPVTHIINRLENFFHLLDFTIVNGLEVEDDYHNFNALNIPNYHPVRAEHDTFWFDATRLLRTQTSGVQIHIMKVQKPPIRIISSGRVYRNDFDQTHTPMFHQMEGFIVDKNISFANLKDILHDSLKYFFKKNSQIRFRPSYFPFTKLSAEFDVIDSSGKWIEVLGCGMIHPNVLQNVSIDPEIYSGFAFGIGIERLAMLYYGVNDLRSFFKNDIRFLKQFK